MVIQFMTSKIPLPGPQKSEVGLSFIQHHSELNGKLLHQFNNQHPGQEFYTMSRCKGKDPHLHYYQRSYTRRSLPSHVRKESEEDPTGFRVDKEERGYDKDEAVDVRDNNDDPDANDELMRRTT
jgi:hypothetical protein